MLKSNSNLGSNLLATVVRDFVPTESHHMALKTGDLVTITNQSGEYWEGKCNGASGYFPSSSVNLKPSLKPPPQRSLPSGSKSPIIPHNKSSKGVPGFPSPVSSPSRPIPKFSEISVDEDDEPTPPSRSPPSSPRAASLPALPPRPEPKVEVKQVKEEVVSAPPTPPVGKKTQEDLRKDCLNEIFQTEKDYIEDLETLISVFIFPLRAMAILPENQLYQIFSNVEVFINCNKEMLKELEEKMAASKSGDEVLIGKVFTKLADYFKMYKMYCANQSNSLTTVDYHLRKSPQFKKNMEVCQSDPRCKGLTLQSFLIKPIQRVCKYPLLLRELIRHTPEVHPDYEALQSAFSKINEVVININEGQREAENLQRVLDLQKQIDGIDTLVAPGRRLHKEGDLLYFKNQKSKHGERRHVFFFSDLILLTVKKGDKKYDAKLSIPLDSCKIIVVGDSTHIKNAFELSHAKTQCILSSETAEETGQWVKEIKSLIKEVYQKKALELKKKGLSNDE